MRFGGHETFSLREGWLYKGLKLLHDDAEKLTHEFAADYLGVGRNMAKSIRHWLVATELAENAKNVEGKKLKPLQLTEFARLMRQVDPYFIDAGTWWFLHAHLCSRPEYAFSWYWFFNSFNFDRFERSVCIEHLRRYLEMQNGRSPALATVERDIGCLLASYARPLPGTQIDPEESRESPFLNLELMTYHRDSGTYRRHRQTKDIPIEVLGYVLARKYRESNIEHKYVEVPFVKVAQEAGSPGRLLCLNNEALFALLLEAEAQSKGKIEITGMAGERFVRLKKLQPEYWLKAYYQKQGSKLNAA